MTDYDRWLEQPYQDACAESDAQIERVEFAMDHIDAAIQEIKELAPEYAGLIDELWERAGMEISDDGAIALADKV